METFQVSSIYLSHSSGSKFYEMVQILATTSDKRMLIKRWGSMGKLNGGGQVKIEQYDGCRNAMRSEYEKTLAAKLKGKSDGHYVEEESSFGLHKEDSKVLNSILLRDKVYRHYSSPEHRAAIIDHFTGASLVSAIVDEIGIVEEVFEPEPDRGEAWGSW